VKQLLARLYLRLVAGSTVLALAVASGAPYARSSVQPSLETAVIGSAVVGAVMLVITLAAIKASK
jgi:hypothetical protein